MPVWKIKIRTQNSVSVNYQVRSTLDNDETRWFTTITGNNIASDNDGEERLGGG